jgi:hypothetical protein
MKMVGPSGLNAFLQGLDGWPAYSHDENGKTAQLPGNVYLSSDAIYCCNYYGIYPYYYQTASRALSTSIINDYELTVATYIFEQSGDHNAGAVYKNKVSGALLALGLTRTPDIRLTGLALLQHYRPRLYRSDYSAVGTSKLVILQLGQMGSA